MEKICIKCNISKDIELFIVCKRNKNGHGAHCKDCDKEIGKNYRLKNADRRKKSCSDYYKSHKEKHKKYAIEWSKNNPIKVSISRKKTYEKNKSKRMDYIKQTAYASHKRMKELYPEKFRARNVIKNMIRRGDLPPAKTVKCCKCENMAREYHHFKGYSEEMASEVIPVCKKCHIIEDKIMASQS